VDQGSEGRPLVLDIEGVDRLELSAGVTLGAVCDLDEIGFKNPDDDDLDWLVSESHATSSDHLVFSFGPKEHIRVHGKLCQMREYHRPMHSLPGGPMAS
jgi:hypothetical protein